MRVWLQIASYELRSGQKCIALDARAALGLHTSHCWSWSQQTRTTGSQRVAASQEHAVRLCHLSLAVSAEYVLDESLLDMETRPTRPVPVSALAACARGGVSLNHACHGSPISCSGWRRSLALPEASFKTVPGHSRSGNASLVLHSW